MDSSIFFYFDVQPHFINYSFRKEIISDFDLWLAKLKENFSANTCDVSEDDCLEFDGKKYFLSWRKSKKDHILSDLLSDLNHTNPNFQIQARSVLTSIQVEMKSGQEYSFYLDLEVDSLDEEDNLFFGRFKFENFFSVRRITQQYAQLSFFLGKEVQIVSKENKSILPWTKVSSFSKEEKHPVFCGKLRIEARQ